MMYCTNSGMGRLENNNCVATYLLSDKPSKKDKNNMLDTTVEVKTYQRSRKVPTFKRLYSSALCGHWMSSKELVKSDFDRDGWRVSVKTFRAVSTLSWWWSLISFFLWKHQKDNDTWHLLWEQTEPHAINAAKINRQIWRHV